MNHSVIGTCSLCGGAVMGPGIWHGICPPPVSCRDCGASPAQHGTVIEMVPQRHYDYTNVRVSTFSTSTGEHPNKYKPTTS